MSEEQQLYSKSALDKFRQWHFWWLVVFSFLLVITFVYYLPTRFLQQSRQPHVMPGMPTDRDQPHGHEPTGSPVPGVSPMGGSSDDMHAHMDEHEAMGVSHEEMIAHMMSEHDMTQTEAENHMEQMMRARQSLGDGGDHDHQASETDDHAAHAPTAYHEETDIKEGLVVNLNANPVPYNAGSSVRLDFFVNQKPGNLPISASALQVEHAKKMHVVGVRSDMNEFFHIHPQVASASEAVFSINHTFAKPGMYKIWSSIMKDGMGHVFGHPALSVNGNGPREEKKVFFDRNVTSGNYQLSIDTGGSVIQNRESAITFDIHTLNGQEVTVEDYLDAQMHLVFIKDDWRQFIHTHPQGHEHSLNNSLIETATADEGHDDPSTDSTGSTGSRQAGSGQMGDEVISFNVTFPEPGLYKGFAQFRPQGINLPADEAITAEFWVEVLEKSPSILSQWWGLLLVSLILMAILSLVVNNYLKVKKEDIKLSAK